MTKGRSSYDRGMKQPSTHRILGRPIDAFESVVPGYLITIDGRIWSRLTTRGMRDEWEQRDRVSRPRRATASGVPGPNSVPRRARSCAYAKELAG